jgi:hypothetical protein
MHTLRNRLITIGFVGVLAVIGSLMSPRYAAADSTKDVIISNVPLPVSGKVAVKNIDERGRIPYQQTGQCNTSGTCDITFAMVPANKRLVIEEVTATVAIPNSSVLEGVRLNDGTVNSPGYLPADLHLVPQLVWSSGGFLSYALTHRVEWYAEAGRTPRFQVSRLNGGVVNAEVTVTGYLVDLTQ